ncbi:MAG: hypothetical protein PUC82_05745 [bacterium]|nr:hypothetical protein [bacterium]
MNKKIQTKTICLFVTLGIILIAFGLFTYYKLKDDKTASQEKNDGYVLKEIKYDNNLFYSAVYEDKYLYSAYYNRIYDFQGNLLIDGTDREKLSYKSGYIILDNNIYDMTGDLIFDGSNYDEITYINNYVVVKKNGMSGVATITGDIVIPLDYNYVSVESKNCAIVSKKNSLNKDIFYVYDLNHNKNYGPYIFALYVNDELVVTNKYEIDSIEKIGTSLNPNLMSTYVINLNTSKEILKDSANSYAVLDSYASNYMIAGIFLDKYSVGVFDSNFKTYINFEYDDIKNIDDKFLLLKKGNNFKLVNEKGKEILDDTMVLNLYIENDSIVVVKDNCYYYYDFNGNLIYETDSLSKIFYLNDNKYLIDNGSDECKYFYLSSSKYISKELAYSYCANPSSSYLTSDGILYDNDLKKLFDFDYTSGKNFNNYFVLELSDSNYIIVDSKGNRIVNKKFIGYTILEDGIIVEDSKHIKYYFNYE